MSKKRHEDMSPEEFRALTPEEFRNLHSGYAPKAQVRNDGPLAEDYLQFVGIPREHWQASPDKIQSPKVATVVQNYLGDLQEAVKDRIGMALFGGAGVGKTAIASLVAMEAMRCHVQTWMITHKVLQDAQFGNDREDPDGRTTMAKARSSKLLIIDGLNDDFRTDNKFGPVQLEKLLSARSESLLTTVLTSRIDVDAYKTDFPNLYSIMQGGMLLLKITGNDLRAQKKAAIIDRFSKEKK